MKNLCVLPFNSLSIVSTGTLRACCGSGSGSFKANLADLMIAEISPIRQKINQYLQDASQIQKILDLDCQKANDIANNNLNKITKTLGL